MLSQLKCMSSKAYVVTIISLHNLTQIVPEILFSINVKRYYYECIHVLAQLILWISLFTDIYTIKKFTNIFITYSGGLGDSSATQGDF